MNFVIGESPYQNMRQYAIPSPTPDGSHDRPTHPSSFNAWILERVCDLTNDYPVHINLDRDAKGIAKTAYK